MSSCIPCHWLEPLARRSGTIRACWKQAQRLDRGSVMEPLSSRSARLYRRPPHECEGWSVRMCLRWSDHWMAGTHRDRSSLTSACGLQPCVAREHRREDDRVNCHGEVSEAQVLLRWLTGPGETRSWAFGAQSARRAPQRTLTEHEARTNHLLWITPAPHQIADRSRVGPKRATSPRALVGT